MVKTSIRAWPALKDKLAKLHPYDEPEIILLPIAEASEGYRKVGDRPDDVSCRQAQRSSPTSSRIGSPSMITPTATAPIDATSTAPAAASSARPIRSS